MLVNTLQLLITHHGFTLIQPARPSVATFKRARELSRRVDSVALGADGTWVVYVAGEVDHEAATKMRGAA